MLFEILIPNNGIAGQRNLWAKQLLFQDTGLSKIVERDRWRMLALCYVSVGNTRQKFDFCRGQTKVVLLGQICSPPTLRAHICVWVFLALFWACPSRNFLAEVEITAYVQGVALFDEDSCCNRITQKAKRIEDAVLPLRRVLCFFCFSYFSFFLRPQLSHMHAACLDHFECRICHFGMCWHDCSKCVFAFMRCEWRVFGLSSCDVLCSWRF